MSETANVKVIVSGRVQGVAYRYHTKNAAVTNCVHGWVKNRNDSKVEAVFQGDVENVREMINWCWEGSPASSVEGVRVENLESDKKYNKFEIVS